MADVQGVPDLKSEVSNLKSETKEDRNSVEDILRNADDNLKKKKEELYFEKLNADLEKSGKKINSYDDLTVAQRREMEAFEIPDSEMNDMLEDTAKKIQKTTEARDKDINAFEDRIQTLYSEAQQHIEELNNKLQDLNSQLQNPDLKPEERTDIEKQIADANEEIQGWQQLMEDVGPEKGSESPIRKDLTAAIKNHDEARMNGVNGMAMIYPKEKVYNNPIVKNAIVPENKREDFEKQAQEELNKNNQEMQQPEQSEPEQEQPQRGNGGVQQTGAIPQAGVAPTGGVVMGEQTEQNQMSKDPDYAAILGYDGTGSKENARAVLETFLGRRQSDVGVIDNDTRMAMIKDPKALKYLEDSMREYGKKDKNFIKRIRDTFKNRSLNKELKEMIEKTLPNVAKNRMNPELNDAIKAELKEQGLKIDLDEPLVNQLEGMSPKEVKSIEEKIAGSELLSESFKDQLAARDFKIRSNEALNYEKNKESKAIGDGNYRYNADKKLSEKVKNSDEPTIGTQEQTKEGQSFIGGLQGQTNGAIEAEKEAKKREISGARGDMEHLKEKKDDGLSK